MTAVPFIYVPLLALFCYVIIITALLAAKKNAVINTFLLWMFGFLLWTSGSFFMRMRFPPSPYFWYNVSLLSLFSLAYFVYLFICAFTKTKGYFLKIVWGVGTAIILVLTYFQAFLKWPEMKTLENGQIVFSYEMEWTIAIPVLFIVLIVVSILVIIFKSIKQQGLKMPGMSYIILGCTIMIIGNVISIIPGNYFPFDTLAGVFNAFFILYAMYKKRVLKLTLLISKSTLLIITSVLVAVLFLYAVKPLDSFLKAYSPELADYTIIMIAALCMIMIGIVNAAMRKIVDVLFLRDEQNQNKSIEQFSMAVTQMLDTDEVVYQLTNVINNNIDVKSIYVCIFNEGKYISQQSKNPLSSSAFSINEDNPCIEYLQGEDSCLILSEFKSSPLYRSMWEKEKQLFNDLAIACMVGIKVEDKIIGLILLSHKNKNSAFNYNDIVFLSTVSIIAGISIKNSILYERVYYESRYDTLTGLYNHKSFGEVLELEFNKSKSESLALLFIDIDDFKLYNQLYGFEEGDNTLKLISNAIARSIGDGGKAFRYGGKVFAVILPGYDVKSATRLAECIKYSIFGINDLPERRLYKKLTVSVGICVYPFAASNIKELIDNADLACYNAKNNGKSNIAVYSLEDRSEAMLSAGVTLFANRLPSEQNDSSAYATYASTIYALSAAIDAKDHYTFSHSQNVARYSTMLASAIGMNKEHVRIINEAALLHDIGKISIPESILCKESKLSDNEYEIIKSHVNSSIEMIRHLPSMDYVIPAVLGHHERWDGKGYPRGISKENIPISARCLAISDAFDAMTTNRPYRKAFTFDFAAEQIIKNAGTQFDPELAKTFVDMVKSGEISSEHTTNVVNLHLP